MKIKTIDILGFKSFFKKTSLSFLPGITALVGPNGCGKSNIVDAIRWALGEQSAKHLRGSLMEDVIFNGSREKKPLGMAEVSLTFANDNGNAPAQYKEFSEIEVTRRVFRNGESEYFINKAPCRLKDITELFLDTGVGAKAYSIIEQGRVDTIINSKPQELRVLIEEAAGISKYKVRKQEALRKMDATRQNLLRVKDVLGEIEKQISSLKYQAQKLKRFKGIKDRIRTLELALTSQQYVALSNQESLKQAEMGKLKDRQAFLMAEMNSVDTDIVAKKTNLQAEEEKFTGLEKKRLELEYAMRDEENNIARKKEKIGDLAKQSEKALKDMEDNLARLRLEEEEITKSEALKTRFQAELQDLESILKREEDKLSLLKRDFALIRSDLESQREQLFEGRYEISRRENSIDHGKQTQIEYKRRLEQNGAEDREAQKQYEELRTKQASIIQELEKSRQDQELLEKEKETCLDKISRLEQEIREVTEAIATGKENLARLESQKESIQELQKNFEGCSDGVRCIMQKKDELDKGRNVLLGLTADVIETEPRFEVAVESLLGEKLQYVIVKSQAEGVEAVEYLKTQSLGRGSFIPLEIEKPFSFGEKPSLEFPQAIPLISVVKVKEGFEPIIRYLLGDALLVEDLSQALSIWKHADAQNLVTLSGEIVDPRGVITGGNQNGMGSRFLKRKREISELEEKLSFLTQELRKLQHRREESSGELEEKQTLLKKIEEQLVQQKLSLQHVERDLHQNQGEIERVQKKTEFLVLEAQKLQGELAEIEEDLANNLSELEALRARQALFEETFSVLQAKEKECQEKIDSQETSFNHYKNALMDLKAQISSLTSTLALRQKSRENCIYEIDKEKRLREEAEQQAAILHEEITAATIRMDDRSRLFQAYQETLNQQENMLEDLRYDLRLHEEKLKTAQQEFNNLHPSIQELDHELAQLS
ncbi:MAG TPA: chromosome segregation protein SMC, partial [Thermodesulfobacteriota bacterium]|nr:chromosome segregation protein SMC [Thermodesulfobacteriota bacterium]